MQAQATRVPDAGARRGHSHNIPFPNDAGFSGLLDVPKVVSKPCLFPSARPAVHRKMAKMTPQQFSAIPTVVHFISSFSQGLRKNPSCFRPGAAQNSYHHRQRPGENPEM
eukprot:scaffold662_cov364-Pavlova_lutheri.AAC.64